ncbi:hypothetical protein M8J75_003773 [Diaphorina citri]|nr:hypothetical protein M8J75_003773 [Diaphorina citri]
MEELPLVQVLQLQKVHQRNVVPFVKHLVISNSQNIRVKSKVNLLSDPSSLVLPQSKDLIYSVRKISLLYKIIDRFRTAGTLMRGKKNGDLPCAVL